MLKPQPRGQFNWPRTISLLFLALGLTASVRATACQPPSGEQSSLESVRKRFESVDTVIIATIIHSKKVKLREPGNSFEIPGEEDTFRVDRVFKGRLKVGSRFVLTTNLGGCGISAVNDPPWLFSASGGPARNIQKTWLIYRNAGEDTQITDSPYTNMLGPATNDVKMLEKIIAKRN